MPTFMSTNLEPLAEADLGFTELSADEPVRVFCFFYPISDPQEEATISPICIQGHCVTMEMVDRYHSLFTDTPPHLKHEAN
ncbi:hypothetical protein Y1Q_0014444 [Alligator mississippiensis]|uniref:Uncharacterized protein n=1 Tax=Alligator mississippiensis TaxID=8496 RepID=A0A151PCL2_ALLMI|nr:hypothetical protein Y1Q_0014444 [Alligator mississippiensis]